MNTIKPDYSYADPKSKFVWVKHGKKTILEKRVISEREEYVQRIASYPPYMYTSLCPDRRYRR
jgi:hypothetical protein